MSVIKRPSFIAFTTIAFALALASGPSLAGDPVSESFGRMLTPHAATASHANVAPGPADPLIAAVVMPLRDGVWPAVRVDPVAESFARLLNHEPNCAAPPVPAGSAVDPLIAAVVRPLLQSNQITVAALARHDSR